MLTEMHGKGGRLCEQAASGQMRCPLLIRSTSEDVITVIRRFKTGHASALENRPPGGGYWVEESSSSDLRARGFGSVRPVCAGLPVSGGIAAA